MYAELHCLTHFSFLRGASGPQELVERAVELGYTALAITDECSVAGVVRAHAAAKEHGLKLIIGSELEFVDGLRCVLLAENRKGYGQLCRLITQGRRAAEKGSYRLEWRDVFEGDDTRSFLEDCLALWLPGVDPQIEQGARIRTAFPDRAWIAVELLTSGNDRKRLVQLQVLGAQLQMPLVASGDVHMHVRGRRALQDTVTAVRLGVPLQQAGYALFPNGERHLRPIDRLQRLYPPQLLQETLAIATHCHFSLDELRYDYPEEIVPAGETPTSYLRKLTEQGMRQRWKKGPPAKVRDTIEHELELIAELKYEPFFLTVHDIVTYAREKRILCQGRGSAANSIVCYCLGITDVDPGHMEVLFERFISRERNEPPDIDVDFEHERREQVIQHIYEKYGRDRAAIAATVITYHARSAIRDVGKALGLDALQVDRLARTMQWWDYGAPNEARIREAGFDPHNPVIRRIIVLVSELIGFPRHLSQHVGGFVISRGPLAELVPVENASMPERTVIQWDKDDLDELGLLKVDVLALGMLTAIRRSFDFLREFHGIEHTIASVPHDEAVYDMICKADTIGVFQIESRAQMSMLPRLRPRSYYDLVIEVAIVRPGPIQGDMVHPYLRRRSGEEPETYPSPEVKAVLKRTKGIPIFQEQVMKLAIVAAGFTPGEADKLRRAMAAWKRKGGIEPFQRRLTEGMRERGYSEEFAQQIFKQILGFGEYGFPESHSASFALLVYVSAWLKCHHPAIFTAALLNSQPMGFYAPAQLVQDARRHGVEVRAVDVLHSHWDCTLERRDDDQPALRLGLRLVKGLSEAVVTRILSAREQATFTTMQALVERARLDRRTLNALAAAGAFASLSGDRHQAVWAVSGVEAPIPLLPEVEIPEVTPLLRAPTEGQDIAADYRSLGLTLGRHPLAILRERLQRERVLTAAELKTMPTGITVRAAGLVVTRQRPGSASGVTFVTLEDETGSVNLIVWRDVAEQQRRALLGSRLMQVTGTLQHQGDVMHVIALRMTDRSRLLGKLMTSSRDFH